jgi:hypothetical protein
LDNEAADSAQLQFLVEDFILSLQTLFCDAMCLNLEGTYTNFMVQSLRRPRVFAPSRSAPERQLGGRPIPDEVVGRCLERMVRYVKLAIAVTVAEFPSFDLLCAFQVFHLDSPDSLLAGPGTRNARFEHAHRASSDTRQDHHLQKLARFFNLDAIALRHQYNELKVCAQKHKSTTHCDNASAWREAVRRFCSRRPNAILHNDHPHKEIIQVLMRYVCFSISTAAVEQDFAILKRTFGEQGLGGGSLFETRMVKLVLMRHTTQEPDNEVFCAAQPLYVEYGGVDKGKYKPRRDSGIHRDRHGNSEVQWLERPCWKQLGNAPG